MSAAPLYTPVQPIGDVTPPSESLLIMAVSEEGCVWQWDMPLQVNLSLMSQISRNPGPTTCIAPKLSNRREGVCVVGYLRKVVSWERFYIAFHQVRHLRFRSKVLIVCHAHAEPI